MKSKRRRRNRKKAFLNARQSGAKTTIAITARNAAMQFIEVQQPLAAENTRGSLTRIMDHCSAVVRSGKPTGCQMPGTRFGRLLRSGIIVISPTLQMSRSGGKK
jgi:hypothetical protein